MLPFPKGKLNTTMQYIRFPYSSIKFSFHFLLILAFFFPFCISMYPMYFCGQILIQVDRHLYQQSVCIQFISTETRCYFYVFLSYFQILSHFSSLKLSLPEDIENVIPTNTSETIPITTVPFRVWILFWLN